MPVSACIQLNLVVLNIVVPGQPAKQRRYGMAVFNERILLLMRKAHVAWVP